MPYAETKVEKAISCSVEWKTPKGIIPTPDGYEYLPTGDAVVTRRAKALAKHREEEIFIVRELRERHWKTVGYLIPASTLADARAGHKPSIEQTDSCQTEQRNNPAQKGAKTRKLRKAAEKDSYAAMLLALRTAQRASDQAKDRAANGMRSSEYRAGSRSKYARSNYRMSRDARSNDYRKKSMALMEAAAASRKGGVVAGWQRNEDSDSPVGYVIYFDLRTGQVSFHSETDCGLPPYEGEWDRLENVSNERIEAAIEEYLAR